MTPSKPGRGPDASRGDSPAPAAVGEHLRDRAETGAARAARPIRVVVADEAPVVLTGLRAILARATDLDVVGVAGDCEQLIQLALEHRPDVIILDIVIHGSSGLDALQTIRAHQNGARALAFSNLDSNDVVRLAFESGVNGYIVKRDAVDDLPEVIRRIHAGNSHVSPRVSEGFVSAATAGGPGSDGKAFLTARQLQILRLMAQGSNSREIAENLGIRLRTVHTHRARMMQRLDVHTASALVYKAVQLGIVKPE